MCATLATLFCKGSMWTCFNLTALLNLVTDGTMDMREKMTKWQWWKIGETAVLHRRIPWISVPSPKQIVVGKWLESKRKMAMMALSCLTKAETDHIVSRVSSSVSRNTQITQTCCWLKDSPAESQPELSSNCLLSPECEKHLCITIYNTCKLSSESHWLFYYEHLWGTRSCSTYLNTQYVIP